MTETALWRARMRRAKETSWPGDNGKPLQAEFYFGNDGVFFDDGSDAHGICLFGPLLAQLKTRGDDWVLELEWWDLPGERHITEAPRSWVLDNGIVEMLRDAGLFISGTNEALDLLRRYLRAATIDPWAEYSSTGQAES